MANATGLSAHAAEQVYQLPTELVDPDPKQPRSYFDPAKMELLKRSIQLHGVETPGVVAPKENGRFDLVDGERRYRVCRELGIPFPARIKTDAVDFKSRYITSVVLNFNRADHTPLETAKAIEQLLAFGLSMEEVAASISMSVPQANTYRLILSLHPKLQPLVEPSTPKQQRLTLTLVKILVRLPLDKQVAEWTEIQKRRLSPRKLAHELTKAVERHGGPRQVYRTGRPPKSSDWMRKLLNLARHSSEQGHLLAQLNLQKVAATAAQEDIEKAVDLCVSAREALAVIIEELRKSQRSRKP